MAPKITFNFGYNVKPKKTKSARKKKTKNSGKSFARKFGS
jgi:hypothetical protein